jgi:Leucine-rich repeat (LRR) protein
LYNTSLTNLPAEIGNLTNLEQLDLGNNNLTNLPTEIGNLTNLYILNLINNNLTSLSSEILKIKNKLLIDETSYEINNMDLDAEFIVLSSLEKEITNLLITLKEIWLKEGIDGSLIKVPFSCKIKYFI